MHCFTIEMDLTDEDAQHLERSAGQNWKQRDQLQLGAEARTRIS